MSCLKIFVNGTAQSVAGPDLAAVLDQLGYGGERLATAVNETFVPGTARGAHLLSDGDRIEIVSPRQGG